MLTGDQYERLADDFVRAFDARDDAALDRLNLHYRRRFTYEDLGAEIWRRVYAFRQRSSRVPKNFLLLDEARLIVAQDVGYPSWSALLDGVASGTPPVPPFAVDRAGNCISPQRQLSDHEWDALLDAMTNAQVTSLNAQGLMTDAVLGAVARMSHVTTLALNGSRQLTDAGLRHLAEMPQLENLDLSGVKMSDDGLEVLRHLRNLRRFTLCWHGGVSDAGLAHLASCEQLESVNLMGSNSGDGAVRALQGKTRLREFHSGRHVTDEGLRALRDWPTMRSGETSLLLDGPFTDDGLAALAGLDGIAALDLFWHCTGITAAGFAHLAQLPNLHTLGADGALSNDQSFQHMASFPRLRKLRAQEADATDAGFEALSRSRSLESLWGRECKGFGNRGFLAFSKMSSLKELGIGCGNVDETALAAFPDFPALQSLTPIGVTGSGFRHVGRCAKIERLTCMYCRTITDVATEHIVNLPIRYYYAGLTQITDRSLEIMGRMPTLEQVEFYEVDGITDAGLPFLAALPNLREVAIDSSPRVTFTGTRVFPPHVRVRYTT
jgi:hypothetical protein